MVIFTTENIITFCAVVVAIASLGSSLYFNKKTLTQSERNLEIQLTHKDRKKALYKLSELIRKDLIFLKYYNEIKAFLSGFEGQFIPEDIRKKVLNELNKMDKFSLEEDPSNSLVPTEKEILKYYEQVQKDEEERQKRLDPMDKFNEEFSNRLSSFKGEIISEIKYRINKPTKIR